MLCKPVTLHMVVSGRTAARVLLESARDCPQRCTRPLVQAVSCQALTQQVKCVSGTRPVSAHPWGATWCLLSEHVRATTRIQAHLVGTWPTISWNACKLSLMFKRLCCTCSSGLWKLTTGRGRLVTTVLLSGSGLCMLDLHNRYMTLQGQQINPNPS